jgi:peroxiredoxin
MGTEVKIIIEQVQTQLQDVDGDRWSAVELVQHADAAQLAICESRPDQFTSSRSKPLVPGYKQSIDEDVFSLVDITHNLTLDYRRIVKVDPAAMDVIRPGWRKSAASREIKHFMHNLDEPRIFYVFPPALDGAVVEEKVVLYPAQLPVATGPTFQHVTGNLSVGRKWDNAVYNFVMFKAYSKDAEFGGNATLATGYKALFTEALGIEAQTTASAATAAS